VKPLILILVNRLIVGNASVLLVRNVCPSPRLSGSPRVATGTAIDFDN